MYQLLQQLLPLLITLTTGTSVLLHGSHVDRVTALSVPVPFSTEDASDLAMMLRDQHVHTERVVVAGAGQGINISEPGIAPRTADDKKYIASKKLTTNSSGSEYIWPSI